MYTCRELDDKQHVIKDERYRSSGLEVMAKKVDLGWSVKDLWLMSRDVLNRLSQSFFYRSKGKNVASDFKIIASIVTELGVKWWNIFWFYNSVMLLWRIYTLTHIEFSGVRFYRTNTEFIGYGGGVVRVSLITLKTVILIVCFRKYKYRVIICIDRACLLFFKFEINCVNIFEQRQHSI